MASSCFIVKVNESRHKQYGVTPHFSTGQNLLKKISRKDRQNHLRKVFDRSANHK